LSTPIKGHLAGRSATPAPEPTITHLHSFRSVRRPRDRGFRGV